VGRICGKSEFRVWSERVSVYGGGYGVMNGDSGDDGRDEPSLIGG